MDDFVKGGTLRGEYRDRGLWWVRLFEYGRDEGEKFMVEKVFGNIVYGGEFDGLEGGIKLGVVGDNDEGVDVCVVWDGGEKGGRGVGGWC